MALVNGVKFGGFQMLSPFVKERPLPKHYLLFRW